MTVTPARAVRDRAEAMLASTTDGELGFSTDATADPVLIGLATRRTSCVIAVSKADYDSVMLRDWRGIAQTFGFPLKEPSAFDRATRTHEQLRR